MNKGVLLTAAVLAVTALTLAACSKHQPAPHNAAPARASARLPASARTPVTTPATAASPGTIGAAASGSLAANAATAGLPSPAYIAHLHPLNSKATGLRTHGEAQFAIKGDQLTIRVSVEDAPPGIAHWQHLHGFTDGKAAQCASNTSSDANHDGVVDLIETEAVSGTTLVPLNADPTAMKIASNTYPKASVDGSYVYRETVSLKALQTAFAKAFKGRKLDLAKRVVYIHGVPSGTKLPATAKSLNGVPVDVTLPIACGVITPALRNPAAPGS